jgi:hypothetical protein
MTKMTLELELSEVQIIVDENNCKVTLVPSEIMVHKGDIAFQVVSTGWRFAPDGIKFNPISEDGKTVPEGLFTQIKQTDPQLIVFHDRYDKDKWVAEEDGRFGYKVKVEKTDGTPLCDDDGVTTSGVVVNQ